MESAIMSNENNDGVIDFDGSSFIQNGDGNNMTSNDVNNTTINDASSNGGVPVSDINVDDIFGAWSDNGSSTQEEVKPVSNDYNNSVTSVDNKEISTQETSQHATDNLNSENLSFQPINEEAFSKETNEAVLPLNVAQGDIQTEAGLNDNSKVAINTDELTALAMSAMANLTNNVGTLESTSDIDTSKNLEEVKVPSEITASSPDLKSEPNNDMSFNNQGAAINSTSQVPTNAALMTEEDTDSSNDGGVSFNPFVTTEAVSNFDNNSGSLNDDGNLTNNPATSEASNAEISLETTDFNTSLPENTQFNVENNTTTGTQTTDFPTDSGASIEIDTQSAFNSQDTFNNQEIPNNQVIDNQFTIVNDQPLFDNSNFTNDQTLVNNQNLENNQVLSSNFNESSNVNNIVNANDNFNNPNNTFANQTISGVVSSNDGENIVSNQMTFNNPVNGIAPVTFDNGGLITNQDTAPSTIKKEPGPAPRMTPAVSC